MPAYKFPNMIPDWADPAQSSVMDPLYKTLARRAVSTLGLDDPNAQMMQAAVPGPLVSIYPNAAARQVGTDRFVKMAEKIGPAFSKAAKGFAESYPRVAAHLFPWESAVANHPEALASVSFPSGKVTGPMPFNISPLAKKLMEHYGGGGEEIANNLLTHEGTHAAQALGNSNLGQLYRAGEQMAGYENNPFEMTARSGETIKGEPRLMPTIKGGTAIQTLADMAENTPKGTNPRTRIAKKAASTIQDILANRAAKGWTPSEQD